jgi:hypothetical protein
VVMKQVFGYTEFPTPREGYCKFVMIFENSDAKKYELQMRDRDGRIVCIEIPTAELPLTISK